MYPYNSFWSFGGGGTGGFGLPQIGGGPTVGGGALPWWAYLGEQTGAFDWVAENIFGQDPGGAGTGVATTTGGYPTTVQGMPVNFVSQYLNPLLVPGTGDNRQRVLQSYQDNPDIISRFLDWLKVLGAVGSLLANMASSTIFEWPIILQDLILLFYHDEVQAVEIGPAVVAEANRNTAPTTPGFGGGYSGALQHYAPPIIPAVPVMRVKQVKGYVTVTDPTTGQKALMLKALAKAAGLYKPRRKPPISAKDWAAAKAGQRIERKLAGMMKSSCNYTVRKKR